ncbi:succinylglutamate desuccinylase/aspartoacylase family protein [Dawidia soli]|uniref:Succinylglutamate desuccinylase/aspartoacylase family protein n=1 Tax=Dawidia soli TaxID=2782352 RepID=A0AAP2DBM8_9BACT|nr:M14 family metallopeptidase [Dawidia soli]MBT1688121.1 succinylglutamate desuccinylase/aspartoacylase family protein [Dawidia soli]
MKSILVVLLALGIQLAVGQDKPFAFQNTTIKPGERKSFSVTIKAPNGDTTFIPITVLHGKSKGPVLGLIAGIHGYEYPPIMALQELPNKIDPEKLRGTIIMVRIANVNAFFKRSVFYNPADGKNLNRVFPGNKAGTITECIAHTITTEVISRCDYLVDIHAGDASEDLQPYVGFYTCGKQFSTARKMADALGFPWVIGSDNVPTPGNTKYCSAEAVSRGIPTVAIEYGKLGHVTSEEAGFISARLMNMMRTMEWYDGVPQKYSPPVEIKARTYIEAEHTGIFYPNFKSGALIRKGTLLGTITDPFNNTIQEILSPIDGFIIYMTVTPPITKGETIFSLGSYPNSSIQREN